MHAGPRYVRAFLAPAGARPFAEFLVILAFHLLSLSAYPQAILKQTIRGTVTDAETQAPLPGATVVVVDSDPLIGATTDLNGNYRLENVPIGKHRVRITFVGYAPYTSDEITVVSGKQAILDANLRETVLTTPEVEIKSGYRKYESINRMATVSTRSFSTDETNRFAGSYGDPARMAANFAGVTSGIDNRNDLVIRGNTPVGLQWQVDGMEIPNPNHFAAVGTTGGPVTVLNNNLLTNSDFLTGPYPAQYGNALSGIFDMKVRTGNTDRHEYWFQLGWNGLEFGAEGPFSKKSKASYIASYRYSLLKVLSLLSIGVGVTPEYQDLNVKIVVPTAKAGTLSFFLMGGTSFIRINDNEKPFSDWTYATYGTNVANGSDLMVTGISHTYFFNQNTSLKTMLYFVGSKVQTTVDTFTLEDRAPKLWGGELSRELKYSGALRLTHRFDRQNTVELGAMYDYYDMQFHDSSMYLGQFRVNTDADPHMHFLRGFAQYQHKFTDVLSSTFGVYGSYLALNQTFAVEPRFGMEWVIRDRHTVTLGAGLYSQMQPRVIYFVQAQLPDGSFQQTNQYLDFSRNAQAAAGYNFMITEVLRFKTEAYYQYLYDLPVKQTIPEYGLINQGHEFFLDRQYADSLVSEGSGTNYGLEVTLEKFLDRNYYFLFTSSLFQSTYKAYDRVIRPTAFAINYSFTGLGGYEFKVGKKKRGVISFGLRATWAGGNPYIPYDVDQTLAVGEPVYDWSESYVPRFPEYKRFSFRFGIRRNREKQSIELIVDLQYRTSYTNLYLQTIDVRTGQVKTFFDTEFFPMATWRIQF